MARWKFWADISEWFAECTLVAGKIAQFPLSIMILGFKWYKRLAGAHKYRGLNKTQRLKSRLQEQNPPTRVEILS
jgi:hypothetical protein